MLAEIIEEPQDINDLLQNATPQADFVFPPKCVEAMDGQFLEYLPGKSLKARFPVLEAYENPMGNMQGGMIITAIDNVMGPLCLLEAGAAVTTHINSLFLRPIVRGTEYLDINVEITERTKRFIHLKAEAFNTGGKVAVSVTSTFALV